MVGRVLVSGDIQGEVIEVELTNRPLDHTQVYAHSGTDLVGKIPVKCEGQGSNGEMIAVKLS